jgi:hypothetical protein
MPEGDKSLTRTRERKAEHIEEGYKMLSPRQYGRRGLTDSEWGGTS